VRCAGLFRTFHQTHVFVAVKSYRGFFLLIFVINVFGFDESSNKATSSNVQKDPTHKRIQNTKGSCDGGSRIPLILVSSVLNRGWSVIQDSDETKLHGPSPRANYTDRATAACRRSDCQLVRIEGATWSA
jgi:hypothetical protein